MKGMLLMKYMLLIGIFVFLNESLLKGQTKMEGYRIYGSVADSITKKPISYTTVQLIDDNISERIAISKEDGAFDLTTNTNKLGKYSISIVSIGYKRKVINLGLHDSTLKVQNLGTIYLSPQSNQMKEVVITGVKPLIKQEIDRITYDLEADPDSKSNTVLGMIRKIPLLSLDADENVLLKGNGNFKILLNGKPSGMIERDPSAILRSIPASTIQKIEVITTPPAKYESEGLTGIINIVTVKKIADGYRGSINLNEKAPAGGPGIGSSFTFKSKKVGLSAFGGASLSNTPQIITNSDRITLGIEPTKLLQNGRGESNSRNNYIGSELSFEIDTLQLVSIQFNANVSRTEGDSYFNSSLRTNDQIVEGYEMENNNINKGKSLDASLNYQLGFKHDKNRLLTLSYRYNGYSNLHNSILDLSARVNYSKPDYRQNNLGRSSEHTFQIDYIQPYRKLTIEAGIKGILRSLESEFTYDSLDVDRGTYQSDLSRSNAFDYDQNVFAAYNSYRFNQKKWAFQAGARVELTDINAKFVSGTFHLNRNYYNITPSFSVLRHFNSFSSFNLGYMARIKRPNIYRLNPFVDRSNASIESSGNPDLRPVVQNSIQLNYSRFKKSSVNLGIEYSFFHDLDLRISSYNPVTNIIYTTYENVGKGSGLSNYFNFNYPISRKWDCSLNGNITYIWVEGISDNKKVEMKRLMHGISVSNSYQFDKGWRFNGSLNINGRNSISFQELSNSMLSSSFSLSRSLMENKLTISASAINPFKRFRTDQVQTSGLDFLQTSETRKYFRSYRFALNYNFGRLKGSLKKNKRGIYNDDVSKGNEGL